MEVYRQETEEIIRRLLDGRITQKQCIASLYAAFTGALAWVKPEDLETIRAIVSNSEKMMKWQRRRGSQAVN